jgi:hypothetical protein
MKTNDTERYGRDFDALTATTEETRARRKAKAEAVDAFCATAIAEHGAFAYRSEMQAWLLTRYTMHLGRAPKAEDKGLVLIATIRLWGDHARVHGVDVTRIIPPPARGR